MDGSGFDRLTRSLVGSRRAALRGLAAGVVAGLLGRPAAAARRKVRAAAKAEKVTVCHKGREIAVAAAAVQAHLEHGDQLGGCGDPVGERCTRNSDCWSGFCDRPSGALFGTCQCPPDRPRVCAESRTCCPACSPCPRPLSTTCGRPLPGCTACDRTSTRPGCCTLEGQCTGVEVSACCQCNNDPATGRYCGTCTTIIDNDQNCGFCGNVCPAGTTCEQFSCA